MYRRLEGPLRLVVVADSAYKSNEDLTDCVALRGYITLIVGAAPQGTLVGLA